MKISKKKAKQYFDDLAVLENDFHEAVGRLEDRMQDETGIDDIVFIKFDGDYCGIGTEDRKMKLIHRWIYE